MNGFRGENRWKEKSAEYAVDLDYPRETRVKGGSVKTVGRRPNSLWITLLTIRKARVANASC